MTLHEAMEAAFGSNETLTVEDLLKRIRDGKLYRQKNGDVPDAKQVALRALGHTYRFEVLIRRRPGNHE